MVINGTKRKDRLNTFMTLLFNIRNQTEDQYLYSKTHCLKRLQVYCRNDLHLSQMSTPCIDPRFFMYYEETYLEMQLWIFNRFNSDLDIPYSTSYLLYSMMIGY